MSKSPAFSVDPFQLHATAAVLLSAHAMVEANHLSRIGMPVTFVFGQAALMPVLQDIARLAQHCVAAANNYEACEAGLTPTFAKQIAGVEPAIAKAVAASALAVETALGGGETPVKVATKATASGWSPANLNQLLNRLAVATKARTINVETSTLDGARHFNLYLPGTSHWSPVTDQKAFDLTSDLAAYAGQGHPGHLSAPEHAALQALKRAGFGKAPGDNVTVVGYSEGGMIGANLISGGALAALGGRVLGLVSVGGPISDRRLPAGVKVLSLEHANDPVPKLDLAEHPTGKDWTTEDLPAQGLLGHGLSGYRQTVAELPVQERHRLDDLVSGLLGEGQSETKSFTAVRSPGA